MVKSKLISSKSSNSGWWFRNPIERRDQKYTKTHREDWRKNSSYNIL